MKGQCRNMKIVLWGEGKWIENAFFEVSRMSLEKDEKIDIEYYISNEKIYFMDKDRYTYETAPQINSKFIVLAFHDEKYLEIKKKLIKEGKTEFKDFIGYRMFNRKICVINANCYGIYVKQFLEENSEFRDVYGIYPIPPIHQNEEGIIDDNILKHTDLYIHQDIRKDNKISVYLSDEYIIPKLNCHCMKVCIPNFVGLFDAFYPNICKETYNNIKGETMFFKDIVIEEAYNKCVKLGSLDDIIAYIDNYRFDDKKIYYNFNQMMNKISEREKNWDIKISDYILENFQEKDLVEDINHPTYKLLHEICTRLLKVLNINNVNYEKIYSSGCAMETFIMPQVKKILGMKWKKEKIRLYTIDYCYHDRQPINYRQYVQEYVWRVFGTILV